MVDLQAETHTGQFAGLSPTEVLEGVLHINAVRLASITGEDHYAHDGEMFDGD